MPSLNEILAAKGKAKPGPVGEPVRANGLKLNESEPSHSGEGVTWRNDDQPSPNVEQRNLGNAAREAIPGLRQRPTSDDPRMDWVLGSLETDLCIWVEPERNHAWLAVERRDKTEALVLLHRLAVSTRTRPQDPF